VKIDALVTPALVIDAGRLDFNIKEMARALPGDRLRPHVKAHKCTEIAKLQALAGHRGFTCATIRECEGMVAAGLGEDLLLANELVDARRLGALVANRARVTLAVDSLESIAAAASGGVHEVVIDVNVGLQRCGCDPGEAGRLADVARSRGLEVRGVMGYEGHVVGLEDASERARLCRESMELLLAAHAQVGGSLVSAGGTGTYDCNTWATEIQAGSYALMDVAYGRLGLPFRQALFVDAIVISSCSQWSVADAGLKAFGMDHGNPEAEGADVWFCSDEHVTFGPPRRVGDMLRLVPAHVDPTMAYHERVHLVSGDDVLETWPIDLRGW
jgi:D-serine deaminase-like pyridoxal phosphate-dependent protein